MLVFVTYKVVGSKLGLEPFQFTPVSISENILFLKGSKCDPFRESLTKHRLSLDQVSLLKMCRGRTHGHH